MLLIYYFIINIISFIYFYIDKRRAINHKYRISEKSLYTLMLLGGFIGSFTAMQLFCHKTKKVSFTVLLIISLLIHSFIVMKLTT